MHPATVTQILKPRFMNVDSTEYKLARNGRSRSENYNLLKQQQTTTPYDEVLTTLNDPKFLKPVREWEKRLGFVTPIRWINTVLITTFHIVTVVLFLMCIFYTTLKLHTILFSYFMGQMAGFGVTAGVHRHWSHRSYKARWPLKLILLTCFSIAGQNTIYEWVRDHRVHHKYSETTADPHDANRGFFFSHMGWLMMKKHPDVVREGKKIDMSDIVNDPFVQYHTRYFIVLKLLLCFILPSMVPLLWGQSAHGAITSQAFVRYICSLHFTWSVNSFAHLWGNKPYDRHIMPSENRGVSIVAMGEGWHNYHHTFPWDYKAAELGMTNNITTTVLDFFARIGWAYDLKEASPTLVKKVADNRGEQRAEDGLS